MNWLEEALPQGNELDGEAAQQPLRIVVTDSAQEALALRILAREAVPMLRGPSAFTNKQRHQLAQAFAELLDAPYTDESTGEPDTREGGEWP